MDLPPMVIALMLIEYKPRIEPKNGVYWKDPVYKLGSAPPNVKMPVNTEKSLGRCNCEITTD